MMYVSVRTLTTLAAVGLAVTLMVGCSPKVGSDAWCSQMKEKPTGDWTANQAADFAKHCVFK